MRRPSVRTLVLGTLALVGITRVVARSHRVTTGRSVTGGVLMGDVAGYDRASRLLFGTLFRGIAADVARIAPAGAAVLEVGCGPGHLSSRLADQGLNVTGLDLDPAMVERARANAEPAASSRVGPGPTFVVGDAAGLPFADASFDLVVSTFSMHHWSDRAAGLSEIARVLRPGGRVVIWDLKPGSAPFHGRGQDHPGHGDPGHDDPGHDLVSPLGRPSVTPWQWPGPLTFVRRMEFVPDDAHRQDPA